MSVLQDRVARGLVMVWIATAIAASLWLPLHYANQVFGGLPLYDDWAFLEKIKQYAQEKIGLEHIFDRHNGHPSVPARIGYLMVFKWNATDIAPLRWASLIGNIASAVVIAAMMIRAAMSRPVEEGKWRPKIDVLHPAIAFGIPLSSALFLSLGHWETYSVAMCVDNVLVTLSAALGIFAFDAWLNRRRKIWFVAAVLMAVFATFTMTQGMLVWAVFSGMIWFSPDRKKLQRLAIVFGVIFLITLIWNFVGFGGGGGVNNKKNFEHFFVALFLLLGVPVFGLIANKVLLSLVLPAGFILSPAVAYAAAAVRRVNPDTLKRAMPFFGLMAYGLGTIGLIAWGRQVLEYDAIAAPRYAELGLLAIIGTIGVLAVVSEKSQWAGRLLAATVALCVLGTIVTDDQENVMGKYRAFLLHTLDGKLRDPASKRDEQWFMTEFFVNPEFAKDAADVTPWLDSQKQSIFSYPPPPAPVDP